MKLKNLAFLLVFGLAATVMGGLTVYTAMPEPIYYVEECAPSV